MAELQNEPEKIKPEPTKEEKELTSLNKLIFRMHAENVTTIPPGDMRNWASVQCKPRETYDKSKISATIKEFQAACDDMKEKLKKAGLDADPAKAQIEAQVKQVSDSLNTLNTTLQTKFDDWMSNRRSMDKKTVWDPSFTNINSQLESLQETIKTTVEAQTPPLSEGMTKFQSAAEGLNADKLQNQTFNEEVTRLNQSLTQQNRTDFSALKANELGYGVGGDKKIWTKKHVTEAERIEALAEHMGLKEDNAAYVGAHPDDKTWDKRLKNRGGAGLYGRDGSPFYIKVDESGSITAIRSPDDASFLSKVGSSLATIALAPFASFLPDDFWEDRKDKFKSHWNLYPFARAIEEMMDFATIDPSGLQHSKSVVMGYDNCKRIGKYDVEDVMTALTTAQRKGLGFDVTTDLAGALAGSQAGRDVLAAIDAYRAKLQLKENRMIEAGMSEEAKQQPPALPAPATPALSTKEEKEVKDQIQKADEIEIEIAAVNPKEEKEMPALVTKLETKAEELKVAIDTLQAGAVANVAENGTKAECKDVKEAVDHVAAAAVVVEKAVDSPPVKEAMTVTLWQELKDKLVDVRQKCDDSIAKFINEREAEHGIQQDLRDSEVALNVNPNKESHNFEEAVEHSVNNLDHLASDGSKDESEVKKYIVKTQEGVDKLRDKATLKGDDAAIKKVGEMQTVVDQVRKKVSPAPSPAPGY